MPLPRRADLADHRFAPRAGRRIADLAPLRFAHVAGCLLLCGLAIATAACQRAAAPAPAKPTAAAARAALTIPPGPETDAAVKQLGEAADAGDHAAGRDRLLYLLAAFDDARFRRDDASLRVLGRAMGESDLGRGPAATDRVLAFLDRELARAAGTDAETPVRALLAFDAAPTADPDTVAARLREVRALAGGDGPLAPAARLRVAGSCRRALEDALAVDGPDRAPRTAWCVSALLDSTALKPWSGSPSAPASAAPAAPPWNDLAAAARALLDPVVASRGPLAAAATAERRALLDLIAVLSAP
jgi:hypothetical protein